MLIIRPTPPFLRHDRAVRQAPVATLSLVAATYQTGASVTLTFNQAIGLSAFNGEAVFVEDGPGGVAYTANGGVTAIGTTGVRLGLVAFEEGAGSVVTLNAPATTGLVAVNGGGAWAGVMNLLLPFP